MSTRSLSLRLGAGRPSTVAGVAVALALVAAATLVVYPLRRVVPDASTSIVYLIPVLVVSIAWGLRLGILTALISAAAYNFFHIEPTGDFTISESENWIALGMFVVIAVIASWLAGLARTRAVEAERRRREAELGAALAQCLLADLDLEAALDTAAATIADAVGAREATIVLRQGRKTSSEDRLLELRLEDGAEATLTLRGGSSDAAEVAASVVPTLEALLSSALKRDRLQREVVETQALRRSDEMKTALLRAASHDLRTPLTAIAAASEALATGGLAEDERAYLVEAISGEAQRLSGLVDKLLDLSKLESGAAAPRTDWCSLAEVIEAAVEEVAPEGDPEIQLALDGELPLIRADSAQLERSFANLFENAARHSDGQSVQVRGRVVSHRIVIRVIDRGPGIPATDLDRIFEPFYRAPGAEGHTGSGLGLAIVRGFVEVNGGRVWAESLPGQGTVFVIEFPLESTEQQAQLEPAGGAA